MKQASEKKVFIEGGIPVTFIAESIEAHGRKQDIGAHSIFLGQVRRDEVEGKLVEAIEYSAYVEMAQRSFTDIREAMFEKYSLRCMHIYHSLGRVEAGGISLFVFTSSVHRKDAIAACEEIVEAIKKNVAVWGKEILEGDESRWKQNTV